MLLSPNHRYVGQFVCPPKSGRVTLRSAGILPERRMPVDAPELAIMASGVGAEVLNLHNTAHWHLDGLRLEPNVGGHGEVISIQDGERITLRRLILNVPEGAQQKRFILGNGRHITVTQSHCEGVWRDGQDSQAFVAWDGAGPYTITDNRLDAASENVMFGGADSRSADRMPADILIENNFFSKRLAWKGRSRNVKNLFELKAAKRVVVRHNTFDQNWPDGQNGTAIVFTPRNQEGTAPWSCVEDVLFEHNVVGNTPSILNILGWDYLHPSGRATNIRFRDNLFLGNGGRLATIGNEVGTLIFENNTYVQPQIVEATMIALYAEGQILEAGQPSRPSAYAIESLTMLGNLLQMNTYGIHSPYGLGRVALERMVKSLVWQRQALIGPGGDYPEDTIFMAAGPPAPEYKHSNPDFGWSGPAYAPPPPPDQLAELRAELARVTALSVTMQAELARVTALSVTTQAELNRLRANLAVMPTAKTIAQVVSNLRLLGK